jgi:hypothetical protein
VVRLHPPRGIVKPLRLSSPCGDGPAGFGGVIRVSPQSPLLLFLGSAFHGPSSSLLPDSWVLLPSRCTRASLFNRQFGWVSPRSLTPKILPFRNIKRDAAFAGRPRSRWLRTEEARWPQSARRALLVPAVKPRPIIRFFFWGLCSSEAGGFSLKVGAWGATDWSESNQQTNGHQATQMPAFDCPDRGIVHLESI